jgi:hypothetical protein
MLNRCVTIDYTLTLILLIRKGDLIMVQVEVTVTFEGKSYLTNVIANRETSDAEIFQLALEQVQKQWKR